MQLLLKLHLFPSKRNNQWGQGNSVSLSGWNTRRFKASLCSCFLRHSRDARSEEESFLSHTIRIQTESEPERGADSQLGGQVKSQRFTSFKNHCRISACCVTAHFQPMTCVETGQYFRQGPVTVLICSSDQSVSGFIIVFIFKRRNLSILQWC